MQDVVGQRRHTRVCQTAQVIPIATRRALTDPAEPNSTFQNREVRLIPTKLRDGRTHKHYRNRYHYNPHIRYNRPDPVQQTSAVAQAAIAASQPRSLTCPSAIPHSHPQSPQTT